MARFKRGSRRLTPRTRRLVMMVVAVGAGAFLMGFGLTALSFMRSRGPVDVVTVPDVREMELDEANRTLRGFDLTLEVGDSLPNPILPAGAVLAQSPLPGQEVSPETQVRVILSTGRRRPQVPEVDAMPLAQATRALQSAGFEVLVQEAPGEGEPGRVVDTNPPAGTPVPLPATVTLRVGAAAPPVEMPSLIGMLETNARSILQALGLNVTEVQYEMSQFGELGGIVGQDPAPGDSIIPGSPVRLRVTGPPPAPSSAPAPPAEAAPVPAPTPPPSAAPRVDTREESEDDDDDRPIPRRRPR